MSWLGPLNPVSEPFAYSPAVVSWGLSRLDVFGISSGDGSLRHNWFDGQIWHSWENLGGAAITASPAACSWGPDRLDVFVRGENGSLFWRYYDPAVWGAGLRGQILLSLRASLPQVPGQRLGVPGVGMSSLWVPTGTCGNKPENL
jgi:hypothetical protein